MVRNVYFKVILICFAFSSPMFAQKLDIVWNRIVEDTCSSLLTSPEIIPLRDENFLVGLLSREYKDILPYTSHQMGILKKVDKNANVLWNVRFDEYYRTHLKDFNMTQLTYLSIAGAEELSDGNIVAFFNIVYNMTNDSTFVACISSDGQKLWTRVIPQRTTKLISRGNSIDVLMFYGWTQKAIVRRFDQNISNYYDLSVGEDTTLKPIHFTAFPDGGHLFSGYINYNSSYNTKTLIWRTNQSGNIVWKKEIGEFLQNNVPDIYTDKNGRSYFTLAKSLSESSSLVCIDGDGNTLWTTTQTHKKRMFPYANFTESGDSLLIISHVVYETQNSSAEEAVAIVSVCNKFTGTIRTSSWRNAPPYSAALKVITNLNGDFFGIIDGPLLNKSPSGNLLKFDWNYTPVFESVPDSVFFTIKEDQQREFNFTAIDNFPGDFVRYHILKAVLRNCSIDSLTGILKVYPTEEYETGHTIVTIAANDRLNQADTLYIHLNVEPVNDAPSVTSVQVFSLKTDTSRQTPVTTIAFKIHVHDPESDSITHNISGSNCSIEWASDTCYLRYDTLPSLSDTLLLTIADQQKASRSYYLIVNFNSRYISVVPYQSIVKTIKNKHQQHFSTQTNSKRNHIAFDLAGRRMSPGTQTRYFFNNASGIKVVRNEQQCKYQKVINGISPQKE